MESCTLLVPVWRVSCPWRNSRLMLVLLRCCSKWERSLKLFMHDSNFEQTLPIYTSFGDRDRGQDSEQNNEILPHFGCESSVFAVSCVIVLPCPTSFLCCPLAEESGAFGAAVRAEFRHCWTHDVAAVHDHPIRAAHHLPVAWPEEGRQPLVCSHQLSLL